jgi:protein-S-isoprenylcysteine O-methyltransferase Ste14
MDNETTFRALFILASIGMIAIRVYYQSKVLRDKRRVEIKEDRLSLIVGSVAALTSIVFGAEYIFFAGAFSFAYALSYPDWIRWLGGLLLVGGVALLGIAHHHLGKSFHSLMVSKEEHTLVESGPYRWIRHPIYTAYLMAYVGGGLLASNWVLTIVPVTMYAILVGRRMGKEEKMMEELFGHKYVAYEKRAGRLVPRIK